MWTVQLFLEEVVAVRRALGLERVHLLGQSWGGMFAMECALTKPNSLTSLIVSNSPASIPQWIAEANRLRAQLPKHVQETLLKHEAAGTTDHPAYQEAMMVLYRKHVCRLEPWPDCANRTFQKIVQNPEVYLTMNGPSEFHAIGTLKNWDITNRLGEIRTRTLVMGGRYDEATPTITQRVRQGIPNSELVIFENSSHMPFVEETKRYMETLDRFLSQVEAGQSQ
jgi:L-proline amide hydrolase